MRVAVLVLASHTPRALFALAQYFAPSDVDIFVHVDAKTDFTDYRNHTHAYPPRVHFLSARRRVYWGGFSMVEATLDLLRAAVLAGPYDRYVFISDNSLPVQSLDGFFATLAARDDLIDGWESKSPQTQPWYDNFYMLDDDLVDLRRGWITPRPVQAAMQDKFERLMALKARGKKPAAIFYGHASWALGPDSVRLVLDAVENDPWWVESCRFALFSDEIFFHSIVCAAKYPGGVDESLTYTDFFRFRPRVIKTSRDLPYDMHRNFLFLRKIAPDFASDLPETCLRLYGGVRHLLAHDPALRGERVIAVSDAGVPHLHLLAPAEDEPAWGPRQIYRGRRQRRLISDAGVWRLRGPANWPHVRVSLPCVSGAAVLPPHTEFEIDGKRMPLAASDIGFHAEFRDLPRAFDTITLRLPPGERPELQVAVMPVS
jgi:hypothetical protein